MNIDNISFSQPVAGGGIKNLGEMLQSEGIDMEDEKRKEVARNFEGVFLHQILEKMKDTIPESDLEDSSSKQIKSMYWSFMSDALADQGGFGLWEKIYEQMPGAKSQTMGNVAEQGLGANTNRLDESA
ncbi:MAG TPA: hypothetical protein ENH94_03755 [Phycisphaerales bacterium]|nr:hypothetical protein [Phycisphaerales bacterium]